MSINVNQRIIKKIRKFKCDDILKEFSLKILMFELEHYEEARPKYRDEYDGLIKKYVKKYEGKYDN